MTDLLLRPDENGRLDLVLGEATEVASLGEAELRAGDLGTDEGLYTAVALSLLCDGRAESDDTLPGGGTDRRGWWADALARDRGDRFGSRLWLRGREKELPEVREAYESYAREALQWLLDDRVARSLDVTAETAAPGVMELRVQVIRGDGRVSDLQFSYVWEGLNAA